MNINYDPKRMAWRDPEGQYMILLDHLFYLCDDPNSAGGYWSDDMKKALRFKSHDDADHISTGLVLRKTIIQGKLVYSIDNDGQLWSCLSIVCDTK
jgi:hypothetical protein